MSMTKQEAVNWIINLSADIGKIEHQDLWRYEQALSEMREMLESAQPEQDEWCTDCKEYDSEKHCCHRFGKVIRKTVEELKADNPEIIRCGKCKHRDKRDLCDVWDEYISNEDFYCGCAERKEE